MLEQYEKACQFITDWKRRRLFIRSRCFGQNRRICRRIRKKRRFWWLPVSDMIGQNLFFRRSLHRSITTVSHIRLFPVRGPMRPMRYVYRSRTRFRKRIRTQSWAVGGGSTIDAVKSSCLLAAYSVSQVAEFLGAPPELASTVEPYFGVGTVTKLADATGITPKPLIAVETVASSGAHLTKYSNITDLSTGQEKTGYRYECCAAESDFRLPSYRRLLRGGLPSMADSMGFPTSGKCSWVRPERIITIR